MIDKVLDEQMKVWLEKNRETILAKWMELASIPSVQGVAQPNAPFGPDCAKALKTCVRNLEDLGLTVKHNEEEGYAVAEYGEGAKCLGLFGHSDVVPAGEGWIHTDPFKPAIKNGWLVGRGVRDNKGGIMATWCVLSMLKELNISMKNRLQIFVGSNEESGMKDMEAFVRNENLPDLALVPDSHFPCGLGEKGILRMWARCNTPLEMLQDMKGGNAFNIVLDRVETVLAANEALAAQLKDRCDAESGSTVSVMEDGTICIGTDGISKHAAYPPGSLNATWRIAQLLADCDALAENDRKAMKTVAKHLQGYWGEGLGIAHEDADFGKLTCANGMVKVEDGHLLVSLDIRYGITFDPKELEQKLYAAWEQAGWQVTYMENRPGYSADPASPFPAVMKAVAEEFTQSEQPFYRMPGGTYGRYLPTAFPVGFEARRKDFVPGELELPAGHGGAHQRDETINIEDFLLGVRVLAHQILECDQLL